MERIRDVMLCSFRFISKRSLLDETKAISIPEKYAEKAIVMRICIIISMLVNVFYLFMLSFLILSVGCIGAVSSTVKMPVVFLISYSVNS